MTFRVQLSVIALFILIVGLVGYGTGMGTFSIDKTKNTPFVYIEQIGKKGVVQILGVVVNRSDVKHVMIIFPNGYVTLVPVHSLFWYVGKPGTSKSPKQLIGISGNGDIVKTKRKMFNLFLNIQLN